MRSDAPLLRRWCASYLGCAAFLLLGTRPGSEGWLPLAAELGWLALLGSIPITLVLSAVWHARAASRTALLGFTIVVAALVAGLAWPHTDMLLAGPRWALHPRRAEARITMALILGASGGAGWLWLVVGAASRRRRIVVPWAVATLFAMLAVNAVLGRYRAYDSALAQLVLPGAALGGALVAVLLEEGKRLVKPAIALSVGCALAASGARLVPAVAAEGERAAIAYSRPGALWTLYVLPHVAPSVTSIGPPIDCPAPASGVETAPLPIPIEGRRNVLLVTVDALREDAVTLDVDGERWMPALSHWAARGVSFSNATSPYPATLYAIGSAFTGLTPAELHVSPALPETVFTRTRGQVDRQLAVLPDVSWFRLPIVDEFLVPEVETRRARTDAEATDVLVEALEQAREERESILAWIHYYAPHEPYRSHRGFELGRGRKKAYLSEVAYFDHQLGRLMKYLDEAGWLRDTLVVFFSDHGEALGERGYFGHHVYLDGWMVDVPLVLWHGSLTAAEPRVGVSLADVAPTVLHFLGLPQPKGLPSRSLLALDPEATGRATFSEAFPVRGEALFRGFRPSAFDEASLRARLRRLRTAAEGYEPKGAISTARHRLVHHRSADAAWLYERDATSSAVPLRDERLSTALREQLERWEEAQLQRIRCRMRLNAWTRVPR